VLTGCTSHYRRALADYRRNEPTPYAQRTLEWTRAAETATTPTLGGPPALAAPWGLEPTTPTLTAALTRESETTRTLAAEFFGLAPKDLEQRTARVADRGQLDRILAAGVDWQTLSFAILAHSPAVRAAAEDWKATLRQYEQAEFLENLINEFRTFTRYLNVETGDARQRQMAQTFFPYPSTIALKGEMVREQARLAAIEWQRTLRDTVIEAGNAFYEYQFLRRQTATTRDDVALLEELVRVVEERYRTGAAAQPELLKAQTERARQRKKLRDLAASERTQKARINALLDRATDAPLGPAAGADPPRLQPAFEEFLDLALRRRQEVRAMEATIAREKAGIRMAEVMNRPLATQGYSVFERGMMPEASPGKSDSTFGMMPNSPPRPAFAQTESYLAEMRKRLQAMELRLSQMRAETRQMARAMIEELGAARREADLIADVVLPQNRSAYESTLASYQTGAASFIDLVDAERMLVDSRSELNDARRMVNQMQVRLASVAGRMLPARRLSPARDPRSPRSR
jgi:outer membrane protein TolC